MYIKNFSFIETKFMPYNIIDLPELKEKTHVFQDRVHAGKVLKEQPLWLMTDLQPAFTMIVAVEAIKKAVDLQ